MPALKYTVIKSKTQYHRYCNIHEALVFEGAKSLDKKDEIDLLTLLIEKWDAEHNTFSDLDPVSLLRSLMHDHHLKAKDLAALLTVSKGYISDILNYKKGFSKEVTRKLATHFKLNQEAFNRPTPLRGGTKILSGKQSPVMKHPNVIVKRNDKAISC